MLILTRKAGEGIRIGEDISVSVQSIKGCQVRLAIEAPQSLEINFLGTHEKQDKQLPSPAKGRE